jgi:hypothetical protein
MIITRSSPFTGKTNTLEIDVTSEQLEQWKCGGLIQEVMPHLTPSEREFIMTGYTDEDWDTLFEER